VQYVDGGSGEVDIDRIVHCGLVSESALKPPWLGDQKFHASHRAALLFKEPRFYLKFAWKEEPAIPNEKGSLPYVWPV